MTKLLKTTIFLFSMVFILSCLNDNDPEIEDSYLIEFGSECGWCAGTAIITLTKNEMKYNRTIPCGKDKGVISRSIAFKSDNWNSLISSYNHKEFTLLESNVCVDGCDEIIRITKDNSTHEIRYNPLENIEGLEKFQEQLRQYLMIFKTSD